MKNKHSLPHFSEKNGNHLNISVFREGRVDSNPNYHFELDKYYSPTSIDGLRARLKCNKGY